MDIFQVAILGFIQGATEFIPISSSGHLDIIPRALGWDNPSTALILFLHIGTLLALLTYYRRLILRYFKVALKKIFSQKKLRRKEERDLKVVINTLLAVLPAIVIGILFENLISNFYDRDSELRIIAPFILIPMIVIGIIFLFEEKFFRNNKLKIEDLKLNQVLVIGLSQAIAFIRGVSRSGITLIFGQLAGLKRVDAAEFSFLISIPILIGTSIFSLVEFISLPREQLSEELLPALVGMVIAFITGLMAVKFLLSFLKNNSLKLFGVYRIALGLILLGVIFI